MKHMGYTVRPVPFHNLFFSDAARKEIEECYSEEDFTRELATFLDELWPTVEALQNNQRFTATYPGIVKVNFVVEPELRATAVFGSSESPPTTDDIRRMMADDVPFNSPLF
jgi:hypothetical protein